MGLKPKAPAPPDPNVTAGAQTATNIGTAVAERTLNNVNQITPDGNLTYNQSGAYNYTDPNSGEVHVIPQYTATQTLSPQQQAIKAQSDAAELNLSTLANTQSGFLQDYMAQPVDLNNDAVEGRLFELGRKRLDPMLAEQRGQLDQKLANQGISIGSQAYDRSVTDFDQRQNDAYNQLLLSGRGQSVNEILTERNQPINEITALLSGSQVNQPNFVSTPQSGVANTDYAGIVNADYQNRLAAANQKNAFNQSILGGLFGLGSAGILAY